MLTWPLNCLDLNLIDHLWDHMIVFKKVRANYITMNRAPGSPNLQAIIAKYYAFVA